MALWGAGGFSGAAVVGFATFGLHPGLLERFPEAVPFFAASFRIFSIGQILVAWAALAVLLLARARFRWVGSFAAVYLLSLASELSGTAFGFPFGPYSYTATLGWRWFGLVPLVIPLSWFMMALPSYVLASRLLSRRRASVRLALGTLLLTAWDLALDPAMSHATAYWRWEVPGAYYGMPWINLAGWLFTSAVLMLALHLLDAANWTKELPTGWLAGFYLVNLGLALGMAAAAGLGGAVVVTLAAYAGLALAVRAARGNRSANRSAVVEPVA